MGKYRLKVKYLERTCDYYPSQWEGVSFGKILIYIRYRGGILTVNRSANKSLNIEDAVSGPELLRLRVGDDFNGYMITNKMIELTSSVLDFSNIV